MKLLTLDCVQLPALSSLQRRLFKCCVSFFWSIFLCCCSCTYITSKTPSDDAGRAKQFLSKQVFRSAGDGPEPAVRELQTAVAATYSSPGTDCQNLSDNKSTTLISRVLYRLLSASTRATLKKTKISTGDYLEGSPGRQHGEFGMRGAAFAASVANWRTPPGVGSVHKQLTREESHHVRKCDQCRCEPDVVRLEIANAQAVRVWIGRRAKRRVAGGS